MRGLSPISQKFGNYGEIITQRAVLKIMLGLTNVEYKNFQFLCVLSSYRAGKLLGFLQCTYVLNFSALES